MNTTLKIRKYFISLMFIASLLVASKDASAQAFASTCSNYTRTLLSDGFTDITSHAGYQQVGYYGYPEYYSYPYSYFTFPLPFDFIYDSTHYSQGSTLYGWSSGHLSFTATGNTSNWNYGQAISSNNVQNFPSLIMAWGIAYCYSYGGVFTYLSGNAPNRVFTIQYNDVETYYSGYTLPAVQIKLYETTNAVELVYYSNGYYVGYGYVGGVGINGAQNGDFNAYQSYPSYFNYNGFITTPSQNILFAPKQITNIQLALTPQPKKIDFGSVQAGTTSPSQYVTVQNVGTFGVLNINNVTITGASDFRIVSTPGTNTYNIGDPPGQYAIAFTPTTSGQRIATLNFASNGQDSGAQSISLIGFGNVAEYTIDSTVRFKKTRTQLGSSLTQYLHITSTGQLPLFISSFNLSGQDAGQYAITYYPVNPLPPGQSDSIGITYTPTLEGRHLATLTLLSNSFFNPSVTISLQGTAILPHIVLTPTILLFDSTKEGQSVCKDITIWNPGSDTLKIFKDYLSSNDGDFHYTGLTAANANIPPDQTRTVNVCFIPLQQGTRQARITLKTNIIPTFDTPRIDTAGVLTIDIRGTGVPFGVLSTSISGSPFIDSALIGIKVCRTDSLMNSGDADIMVTGITINGTQFTYSGLPAFPFLLKARTAMTFTICGTPDKQGLLNGTATFAGTTGGSTISSTQQLGIYGFKACVSASPVSLFDGIILPNNGSDSTICDTVTNCGDIAAIYHASISGLNKADYTVTPGVTGSIPPHGTAIFCVKYKPSVVGSSAAKLDVNAADASTSVSMPLNGADGCAILTNAPATIPSTGDNNPVTFTFTISNSSGTFEWIPGVESIAGADAADFSIVSITPNPIPAGGQATVTMQFHPPLGSQGTTRTAILTWPNAGPCGNALSIDLSGTVVQSSVKETVTDGFSLEQSYPNPTQGIASFSYTTPRESEVRIAIADMTGRIVRTLITGRVSEGLHTVNFDVRDLSSGTYAYILESGNTRLVRQFILSK